MFKKIALILCLFCLAGCPSSCSTRDNVTDKPPASVPTAPTNAEAPKEHMSPEQQKVKTLEEKLAESNAKVEEAKKRGDLIAQLSAEKEALILRMQISEANAKIWEDNAKAYKGQAADKDVEIKNAKIEAWQERLWWVAGICGFAAIVAGAIAWGFPLIRPIAWKVGAILAGISTLSLIVAQMLPTVAWLLGFVPYILYGGLAIAAIAGAIALRHWFKDHHGLVQTIEGIEPLKKNIAGFGEHMLQYVDDTMVKQVKHYRTKIDENKKVVEFKKMMMKK